MSRASGGGRLLFEGANRLRCVESLARHRQQLQRPSSDAGAAAEAATAHRQASVLVPFCELSGRGPGLLYTLRSRALRSHSGQVSFPGGARDEALMELPEQLQQHEDQQLQQQQDLLDNWAVTTALRETAEEIGLAADLVDVWGCERPRPTAARFSVTPVIGYCGRLSSLEELRPNPAEVSMVLFRSLDYLARPEAWRYTVFHRPMPGVGGGLQAFCAPVLADCRPRIWGLTAVFTFIALKLLLGAQFPAQLARLTSDGARVARGTIRVA